MNARLRVMQTPMQTPIVCKLTVVAVATQPFDCDDRHIVAAVSMRSESGA